MRQLACAVLLNLLMCGAGTFAQPRYVDAHIHWDERANFVDDLVRVYRKITPLPVYRRSARSSTH